MCVRNDKESLYGKKLVNQVKAWFGESERVDVSDTNSKLSAREIERNRKNMLESFWDSFSRYKLVITDRYHGTIFSLIASTPVIVLPSTDHKLSSGVNWFPEEFRDYVKYVPDVNELEDVIHEMLERDYDYNLPEYFNTHYYDRLKDMIESDIMPPE